MAGSTQPSNPFHVLLSNLTRHNYDMKCHPYLILLQHSYSLGLRLMMSDISTDTGSRDRSRKKEENTPDYKVYQMAGVENPRNIAKKDLSGSLIVEEALRHCIESCNGFVILVSTTGQLNLDEYPHSWIQHGVVVDLSSDPIGWDQTNNTESQINFDSILHSPTGRLRTITAALDSLSSIVDAIQYALVVIKKLRQIENDKTLDQPDSSSSQSKFTAVPIIFDSAALLLQMNTLENVVSFLFNLKNLDTEDSMGVSTSFPSPIFMPVVNETLTLTAHRCLEDVSDATITLRNGQLLISRRSTRIGGMLSPTLGPCGRKLVRESQKFEVDHDGTLRFGISEGNITKHPSLEVKKTTKTQKDIDPTESNVAYNTVVSNGKTRKPMLNDDDGPRKPISSRESKPKIYMQSDDPEFLDLDEEDPDDDLDI